MIKPENMAIVAWMMVALAASVPLIFIYFNSTGEVDTSNVPAQEDKAWHRTVPTPGGDVLCITYRDNITCDWD